MYSVLQYSLWDTHFSPQVGVDRHPSTHVENEVAEPQPLAACRILQYS